MKNASPRQKLIAALVCVVPLSCTSVDSTDLKTTGMTAELTVTADATGTSSVNAALHVDTNATDYVQLGATDSLTATAGSQSQPMVGSSVFGAVTYTAGFQGEGSANTQYTIALARGAGDVSAPSSTVTMPSPFTIATPSTSTYSRANNDLVISYSPASTSDAMTWTLVGTCINQASGAFTGDPGALTVAHGTLIATGGSGAAGTCQLTLTITRTRSGTVDPAFEGGSFSAAQVRTLTVQSTP